MPKKVKTVKKTSECKKMILQYKKLQKENKYKADFTANIIHDLKNPVTSIQGYIDYLLSGKLGSLNAKQKKALTTSKQSVNNLKVLISRILLIYKLEEHKEKFDIKKTDLEPILNMIYDQEKIIFDKKPGVTLFLDVKKPLPKAYADPDKIKEVIINLVDNAFKFTEKGSVTLSAKKISDDEIEIAIEDTGMGIPKEKVKTLFKRFSQASELSRKQYGGLGLGLVIVKGILSAHKTVPKLSTQAGKGSRFSFTLKTK